jgi:hypothetical protein
MGQKRRKSAKVVTLTSRRLPSGDAVAREQRITALVSIIAVAHQIARRQLAREGGYAA